MNTQGNNATPPGPAVAPGVQDIDPAQAAEAFASRGPDPRITALIPAFDAPFFQAGLAGYSDAAMRLIARRHGCPFCVTEALLDRTLLAGGRGFVKADLGELHDNIPGGPDDHPLAGQLMGSDPAEMAAAALKMVEQRARGEKTYRRLAYRGALSPGVPDPRATPPLRLPGGEQLPAFDPTEGLDPDSDSCEPDDCNIDLDVPDPADDPEPSPAPSLRPSITPSLSFQAIDINLACPVKKVDRKARGGHWLAEPKGAIAILEAVREALPASIPCTVKLRRSYDDTPEMAEAVERILRAAFDIGYAWATIHARTVEQKYIGPSRWDLLRDLVARNPQRPILGSGDIWTAADIFRMISYTGVSAVSVARGCIGNPWIFRQARDLLAGRPPLPPTLAEQREVLLQHFHLALAVNRGMRHAESQTARMMRKFGIRFAAHHPRCDEVRQRMIAVEHLDDWRTTLDDFYNDQ
ncbi:MAG: tRNA-dihydrouridine synthase family protein [Phycisphaerales bacterium]|nr:tRNA-dihydrouridine synthase family protein [Phycisphaerales bacterium]